ncbi:MAG: hypothetical protein QGG36_29485 [Pirellulaceae bacterium]|jgi:[acyl-carrier-protein] S-malonyltransferase|nr:hypothetical protein [Pirellulaceae bacterium]MDP7019967.1 hypothetical protein [Pirellulaceae bacterium]
MQGTELSPDALRQRSATAAYAFRGYNVSNLGRTRELLEHPAYGSIVDVKLGEASEAASGILGRRIDLAGRVRGGEETTLAVYDEAIALVLAAEIAQLQLLKEHFGVIYGDAQLAMGYSLGEIGALVAGGVIDLESALRVPLGLADDCVALADDVTLGVLFSRGSPIEMDEVLRCCLLINSAGGGVVGVSAILSPNSCLVMGQGDTLQQLRERVTELPPGGLHLRANSNRWPPLHTPIVWQRAIPDRASVIMHSLPGGFCAPSTPVLSLVTGEISYTDLNVREIIRDWVDHPQRLWDAVYRTLSAGVKTVLHVGPEPNIIPSTFNRLRDNVAAQTEGRVGVRALKSMVNRPWLKALLPERTALLRALDVEQVIVEDWLLANEPE